MENFDLIIIGAGNASLTLAAALPSSLRIAVIEQKAQPSLSESPQVDGRKIALNYGSKLILDDFNLWSTLLPYTTPILQVHISQQGHFGATRLTASANNTPALGYTIAAEQLNYVLQTKTATQKNITWFYDARVIDIQNAMVKIMRAEATDLLCAKLIIAADGNNSACRQLLEIETDTQDYEQVALITRVKLKTNSSNIAYQRFLNGGSLALLPMQTNHYGVVWIATKTKIAELNSLTDCELLAQLQKNFGYRLGGFVDLEQRFTYPIRTIIAKTQSKDHCLLLGDAAHQISPIVAQGFNLTVQDIYCLVNLLVEGNYERIIERYLAERLPEQHKIISSIEKLRKTFQSPHFPLPSLRSTGLAFMDLLTTNKKNTSELFMGFTSQVQKLLRQQPTSLKYTTIADRHSHKSAQEFDVVIIGSGIVGLSLATALKNTSLKIAIVEREMPNFKWDPEQYDLRVSAINLSSLNFFIESGVWSAIEQERVSYYDRMLVWTNGSELEFTTNDVNQPELGFIIENRVLRKCLWQQVSTQQNVTLIIPCELAAIKIQTEHAQLTTNDGDTIIAKLLIGADGAHSWLRQQLKLPIVTTSYGQHAIVTTIRTELAHMHTAYQHFLPEGTIAFLPLADEHHSSIVWYNSMTKTQQLQNCAADTFTKQLHQVFNKLGTLNLVAQRTSFPINKQHLGNYVQTHVAFVGDAAHTIHPLAGQGLNLGLRDARCLADVILTAITNKKDFGALSVLRQYERERKSDNTLFLTTIDALNYLFINAPEKLTTWRDRALYLLNKSAPLKKIFIKQAFGK